MAIKKYKAYKNINKGYLGVDMQDTVDIQLARYMINAALEAVGKYKEEIEELKQAGYIITRQYITYDEEDEDINVLTAIKYSKECGEIQISKATHDTMVVGIAEECKDTDVYTVVKDGIGFIMSHFELEINRHDNFERFHEMAIEVFDKEERYLYLDEYLNKYLDGTIKQFLFTAMDNWNKPCEAEDYETEISRQEEVEIDIDEEFVDDFSSFRYEIIIEGEGISCFDLEGIGDYWISDSYSTQSKKRKSKIYISAYSRDDFMVIDYDKKNSKEMSEIVEAYE